jgi:hypothetical protein
VRLVPIERAVAILEVLDVRYTEPNIGTRGRASIRIVFKGFHISMLIVFRQHPCADLGDVFVVSSTDYVWLIDVEWFVPPCEIYKETTESVEKSIHLQ